ncbi:MAG TPA: hypothetical protein VHG51_09290, partial [Longimicrobiaceae bacterium]|nr:hypothetical protein [Longimicrobiaceae bacterium]
MSRSSRAPRRRGRPAPPPPAVLFAPGETLPASEVLHEHRSPAGVALWLAARDAALWAGAAPGDRTRLFAPGALPRRLALLERTALPDAGVEALLAGLAALLLRGEGAADAGEAGAACLGV